MNTCTVELTDINSVIQRLKLRLVWCSVGAIPLLVIALLFLRHLFLPVIAMSIFLILYMSGTGFALDRWRIGHPAFSKQTICVISILLSLPMIPIVFFCFNLF